MASALSRITLAMMGVHDKGCDVRDPMHRWANCSATPGVFATADALDVIDSQDIRPYAVALALHDRECQDVECQGGPARGRHAREAWMDQAEALMEHEMSRLF